MQFHLNNNFYSIMIKLGFQGFVSQQVYSLNSSIKEMNAVLEMGNEK